MQAKILQTVSKFAGFLIENNLKVTRVVRTKFESSRVIFRKVTRVISEKNESDSSRKDKIRV